MSQHLLFITGHLAEKSLARVLSSMEGRPFSYEIRVPGINVAALLTVAMLKRRLDTLAGFDKVIVPGRCRGNLEELSAHFGLPFERGPDELKDLPAHFGTRARPREIGPTDITLFAEIVHAPHGTVDDVLAEALRLRADGADVIDIGCLPATPFPHLEDCIRALREAGVAVSVDSLDREELERAIAAGADYVFSLTGRSLELVADSACTPVLIARHPGDMDDLHRTIESFAKLGRPFFADPVLDPIHYGFTRSLLRYAALRERYPDIDILMGIGNLSELTHTDTLGLNTLLLGVVSELRITGLLTTEVSRHCVSVVREVDRARRVMHAAREDNIPPRHLDESLMALHDRHPFPYSAAEIADFAREVTDDNFRIQVSDEGFHIYNRRGLHTARDPYDVFTALGVEADGAHAFYLGLELARAQIAWQLGKRYNQDEELEWGCVRPRAVDDKQVFAAERSTLKARKKHRNNPL
ncbi:MAG: dihydropteroate synthase [Proteobacteria bacterium]|nr:dihydropteroate synthase [Pseudomonadota bacterium]